MSLFNKNLSCGNLVLHDVLFCYNTVVAFLLENFEFYVTTD